MVRGQEDNARRIVADLPSPRALDDSAREQVVAEARAWDASFAEKVAAIEAVTAEDLRAQAR